MNEKAKRLLIVILGGPFGVHKFIDGEIKMGIIYLFTCGIFGIGWLIDIAKELIGEEIFNNKDSLMNKEIIELINKGILPNIKGTNLNLDKDETCCYMDKGYTFKDKTVTTGYVGNNNGINIKIAKGLSYRTGSSESKAIRETKRTVYNGILYITNKRIIYTSEMNSFDKVFDKITAIQETQDGLIIQSGSNTYLIVTKTHSEFMKVYNLLKSKQE